MKTAGIKFIDNTKLSTISNFLTSISWSAITGTLSAQTDLHSILTSKQDTLVSGTNIKTINGTSVLGSGNISISSSSSWGSITGTLSAQTDLHTELLLFKKKVRVTTPAHNSTFNVLSSDAAIVFDLPVSIGALTIVLPNDAYEGQIFSFHLSNDIGAVTWNYGTIPLANGNGMPGTFVSGNRAAIMKAGGKWYRES